MLALDFATQAQEMKAIGGQPDFALGESVPVDKQVAPARRVGTAPAERASMAYAGTSVTAGRGTLLVTSTGMASELARSPISSEAPIPVDALRQRLDTLVKASRSEQARSCRRLGDRCPAG